MKKLQLPEPRSKQKSVKGKQLKLKKGLRGKKRKRKRRLNWKQRH